jgi:hypothetical protein
MKMKPEKNSVTNTLWKLAVKEFLTKSLIFAVYITLHLIFIRSQIFEKVRLFPTNEEEDEVDRSCPLDMYNDYFVGTVKHPV